MVEDKIKLLFDISEEEFYGYRDNMSETITLTTLHDGDWHVLYFDSDSGCALFSSPCEMFEEDGIKLELIDCNYCDITFSTLKVIMEKLRKL